MAGEAGGSSSSPSAPKSPPDPATARRFAQSGEASKELYDGFNDWAAALASYGLQATYAVIAANWAVFGSTKTILDNNWAKWSMVIAIVYLGVHLLLAGVMTALYRSRCEYANKDKARWDAEFLKHAGSVSPWPYTTAIQRLGSFTRFLNVFGPIASGGCLVVGLFP